MICEEIILEYGYNQIRNESIRDLSKQYPDINIENCIKMVWCDGIPVFYIQEHDLR